MPPREWFVLLIRGFGLMFTTKGVEYLISFLDYRVLRMSTVPQDTNPNLYFLYAAVYFAFSFVMLRFTRGLVNWLEPVPMKRIDDIDELMPAASDRR